ncbi:Ribonuclease H-like superfamily [Arabidopsis thaliana x Arabidopsis arenosa]|uniref:Ribonuclease H-like superfamily n=1 Tax=Arabidopsis thaliana x Arabidopsis arenosa TaxID=1240361 RepID=A0A8T2AU66_9BRAS|nr:Ribonuclease H-like superfamily [Arabidopsis thaliana x Arabidopsis arenosa]
MAGNGSNQPLSVPQFKGEKYHLWSLKMKTMFRSQEVWDLVENGFEDANPAAPDQQLRESRKKDAKALFLIQSALDEDILSRIVAVNTSHEAWEILKREYLGDQKVITVKLQTLRHSFETISMKEKETIQEYLARVSTIVSQMSSYGDSLSNETVVSKVLRTLTPKFEYVVPAIMEANDLSTYTFDEMMSSLLSHEDRLMKKIEKSEEKAFQVKGEFSAQNNSGYGRGRGSFRGGRGRGRSGGRGDSGRGTGQSDSVSLSYNRGTDKSNIQCHYCKKYGHMQVDCWKKQNEEKQASFVEKDVQPRLFMAYKSLDVSKTVWYLDSGCSNHMSGIKSMFKEIDESYKLKVKLGDDKEVQVEGRGIVVVHNGDGNLKLIYDVYYIPELAQNLLSVGQMVENNCSVFFDGNVCVIKDKKSGSTLAVVKKTSNNLYPLEMSSVEASSLVAKVSEETRLWHLRYGHLHENALKMLSEKDMVVGLPKIEGLKLCEGCVFGKQTRKSFPIGQARRATQCLEIVHADLCGPMQTTSLGGSRYFLMMTDDYSRMSWVYFLESKGEAFEMFKKFKALVEKQSGQLVKVLRTDRGGEFTSTEFNQFCEREGIHHELTTAYTPEQNSVAERKNRTVVEMARSMLKQKNLPNQFWAESVKTAVYLLNISPTKAVLNKTPYEAWCGRKPAVSHLRVFGSVAYSLVDSHHRKKLDEKSEKCVFLGYCSQSKGYRLYNPVSGKIIESRNVTFDEVSVWRWREGDNGGLVEVLSDSTAEQEENQSPAGSEVNTPANSVPNSPNSSNDGGANSEGSTPQKFRSLRDIYEVQQALFICEPGLFNEAAVKTEWQKAMDEEITSIEKSQTWKLVELPEGKHSIGVKWVFRTKYHADGSVQKYKARLVVKGYAQEYGVDYEETFSPVARFDTVRTLLALGAYMHWPIYQFDVKSAFLNGELLEEVYVNQPEGFVVQGKEGCVYKLQKALYGLKQAPRAWYNKIDSFFGERGFERSKSEPTLYIKKQSEGDILIVCLYVDDMIYMGSSAAMVADFKDSMMKKFEMSDLGLLHYFLGLEIKQEEDGIFVSQQKYAADLLKRFNMTNCNVEETPMNVNEKLQMDDGTEKADPTRFRSLVGGLIYLTHTRPDISFAVSAISRFMHSPTKQHYGAAKRLLRYVAGTTEFGLWYNRVAEFELVGFTDSDWAGCVQDRKSTSGYVFNLGSGAICWSSKKQNVTALSSSEAKYTAATAAACQAVWLRRILEDVKQEQTKATTIFCDNKSTIAMTKNPAYHGRTKHISIKVHFIRDLVNEGSVGLEYCSTNEQSADVLTKALSKSKFEYFRSKLGVCKFESRESVEM